MFFNKSFSNILSNPFPNPFPLVVNKKYCIYPVNAWGCTACLLVVALQSKIQIKLRISPHFAHQLVHKYFFQLFFSCSIKGAVIFDKDKQDRLESKAIVPISLSCPPFEGGGEALRYFCGLPPTHVSIPPNQNGTMAKVRF